jgi:hypothetical protein
MTTRVEGFEGFEAVLDDVAGQFARVDYEPLVRGPFVEIIGDRVESNFANERTASGVAWPKLRPSTIARKGHDTILVETTEMIRDSLGIGGGHIRSISPRGLTYGVDTPHAVFQQQNEGGGGRLPARRFMNVNVEDVDRMAAATADHVLEQLREV